MLVATRLTTTSPGPEEEISQPTMINRGREVLARFEEIFLTHRWIQKF